jgi:four helix bundle protein
MKIERFEEIEAWKEARLLVATIYEITGQAPFKNDWRLKDQIQRASVSIMSNIAEGFMCQTNKEFVVFLGYSLRSTAEVKSLLYAALDIHYIENDIFNTMTEKCNTIARLIQGFIRYLKATTKPPSTK